MPYQTNIPNPAQSPGLFPAQANDNFTRLKTIIGANHKFNDSAATDDGYHQNIKMLPLSVPGNDASIGQSFVNSADATNQLWFKDGLNNVYQITPCLPMRAWVIFDSIGTILNAGAAKFNVNAVVPQGTGNYRVDFTTAMPSIYYNYSLAIVPISSIGATIVCPRVSSVSYSQFIQTGSFQISARSPASGGGTSGSLAFWGISAMFFGG